MVENLIRSAFLFNHARIRKDHTGGHFAGETHLMGHQHHGHALFGQFTNDFEHISDHFRVERRCGLVEQHDFWAHGQGARDGHTLLLTA